MFSFERPHQFRVRFSLLARPRMSSACMISSWLCGAMVLLGYGFRQESLSRNLRLHSNFEEGGTMDRSFNLPSALSETFKNSSFAANQVFSAKIAARANSNHIPQHQLSRSLPLHQRRVRHFCTRWDGSQRHEQSR